MRARPFTSRWAAELVRFLAFKRTLGHPYGRAEFTLRSFDRYARAHRGGGPRVLEETLHGWLARRSGCQPVTVATELGVLRQFCHFRRRYDPRSFVPGRDWAPQSTQSLFQPTILTTVQIRTLLARTTTLRGGPFRAHTIRTLLLILYCTGLRPGEALRLTLGDVDLAARVFHVRASKGKTRFVPFRTDLAQVLQRYLRARRRTVPPAGAPTLLVHADGRAYTAGTASETLRRLFRRTGLKPPRGRGGPRPYDLRHTFCVHRLRRWYRARADLHARLPWLSAYLGHENLLGTEVYLTATPDLLAVASRRFHHHAGPRRTRR